jgi:hypothetical protein
MKKLIIILLLASPVTMLAMENNNNNVKMIDAKTALTMDERETLESPNCDPAPWCTWFWCGPCLACCNVNGELQRMEVERARLKAEFNGRMAKLGYKEDSARYAEELRDYDKKRLAHDPHISGQRPDILDIVLARYVLADGNTFQPDEVESCVESCASRDENLQHPKESGTFDKEK